jgi:hypothetical protein
MMPVFGQVTAVAGRAAVAETSPLAGKRAAPAKVAAVAPPGTTKQGHGDSLAPRCSPLNPFDEMPGNRCGRRRALLSGLAAQPVPKDSKPLVPGLPEGLLACVSRR